MTEPPSDLSSVARGWARHLPPESARALSGALRRGTEALHHLRQTAPGPRTRTAVQVALSLPHGERSYAAGLVDGYLAAQREQVGVTPVWTGPTPGDGAHRLTIGVVADLIAEATSELVVASYATHPSAAVAEALTAAAARGVAIAMLLERPADNPHFHGMADPFPGLVATRLVWPASARPPGSSMHAKVVVVDRRTALVGSANLTGAALGSNLECGVLIRGGTVPAALARQVLSAEGVVEA